MMLKFKSIEGVINSKDND